MVEGAATVKWVAAVITVGLGVLGRTIRVLDPLNLDYLSAQIGHNAAGVGHGDNVSGVYDANAFQRELGHVCLQLYSRAQFTTSRVDIEIGQSDAHLLWSDRS